MTTALLVLDVQEGVMSRYGADDAYFDRLRSALDHARAEAFTVIFVRVGFRSGFAEISPHNKVFARLATLGDAFELSAPSTQLHHLVAAAPNEPVIVKKRVSAFAGSDLELALRSAGVTKLVLAGVATGGVVLSTLRAAADRDYELTVLSDLCLDTDPEVHRVLMDKVFPSQATVSSVVDWLAAPRIPQHGMGL